MTGDVETGVKKELTFFFLTREMTVCLYVVGNDPPEREDLWS